MDKKDTSKLLIDGKGLLQLSEQQRLRWGLIPGAEFSVFDTPDGLLLRPTDPPLRKIYVEPTTDCNLCCRTCMRNSWNEPVGSMEMETYRRLLDGVRDVPSLQTIAFWGIGEPLLHPHIMEMVALAKELGTNTELITNGVLLDREMADGLIEAGLDTLVVSVDGASPESQADIRGGADLRLIQENVKGLQVARRANSHDNPEIGIEFVLMRRNLSDLPELRRFAYSMDANFIILTNVLPYTEELKNEIIYGLSAGHFYSFQRSRWFPEIILPRLDARMQNLNPISKMLSHGGGIDFLPTRYSKVDERCPFVWEGAVAIAWDGELSPCVALMHSYTCYVLGREKFIRRYTLGNVAEERVKTLWNGEKYRSFRKRVLKFDFSPCVYCGGCDLSDSNEEDCFYNTFPVCGDCLWARGIILCP